MDDANIEQVISNYVIRAAREDNQMIDNAIWNSFFKGVGVEVHQCVSCFRYVSAEPSEDVPPTELRIHQDLHECPKCPTFERMTE